MSSRNEAFQKLYQQHRIDDQKRYYAARREEYERAHREAVTARNTILLISAAVGVVCQFVTGEARGILGIVAAVFATLAGAVTAYETLIGYPALSKAYDDAFYSLDAAGDDWLAAPPDGREDALHRVEQVMRTENGQWGQLAVKQAAELTKDAGAA